MVYPRKSDKGLASGQYGGRALRSELPPQSFCVGDFLVQWSGGQAGVVTIVHALEPTRPLWRNTPQTSFLTAAYGSAKVLDKRGFFRIKEKIEVMARGQVLESISQEQKCLILSGSFWDRPDSTWQVVLLALDDKQLSLTASAAFNHRACNRLCLLAESRPEEEFFGFGAQYTHLHMKGRRIPVLCQEPGIGRGVQPLTGIMDTFFHAGGCWSSTYAPSPMCLSTDLRGICLENCEYSIFDLRPPASLRVGVFCEDLRARLFYGANPTDLLEAYTRFCGRMRPLPDWVQCGAIIGTQGGTAAVREILAKLKEEGTAVSAFWLQDWVGKRKTAAGSQLWWSWELDHEQYPGWSELVQDLRDQGIRVLTYVNPFMVDATSRRHIEHDHFAEAKQEGYFVRRANGEPYTIMNTTFSAHLLDLTNPACRESLKGIIRDNIIGVGASGWMADYAEALPFDANLFSHQDAAGYHNEYPIEWAKVNREAITEAGLEDEMLFFTRSGYHRSPGYSTCFWLGDQLTSWSQEDGIKSVVVGLLSSGLSGMSINHADIGGYTSTHLLPVKIPGVSYCRSQELLLRWTEMSAFTAVFRSHEGNVPLRNHQITDHPDTIKHFARFSRIYAVLADYRRQLCKEAAGQGLPMVRHPWLHYPNDAQVVKLKLQYLFGADFMVAPVLNRGSTSVRLYLPAGIWQHLWSGQEVRITTPGSWLECSAPLGSPPVFFVASSMYGQEVAQMLTVSGDRGPQWIKQACRLEDEGVLEVEVPRSRTWTPKWMSHRQLKVTATNSDPREDRRHATEAWPAN